MAKSNNLKDFLTDVADAIREVEGSADPINPQDFSAMIRAISGGGGAVAVRASDVNFRDYDGTILHSYTKAEFLALSALPPLPTQKGLICQEWNFTLADAQEYVSEYGVLEVGATYITDDGKTRLYIKINDKNKTTVTLYFSQTKSQGVTIDWGDNTGFTNAIDGTGNKSTIHTYADKGEYVITLSVADGCVLGLGDGTTSNCVLGASAMNNRAYPYMLRKVEIGKNVTSINQGAFIYCGNLALVTIPKGVTDIGVNSFNYCYALASVVIPNGVTLIGIYAFGACCNLASVSIPNSAISIEGSVFNGCQTLVSATIPKGVTTIESSIFSSNYNNVTIPVPEGVTKLSSSAFYYCYRLPYLYLPKSVVTIAQRAFYGCNALELLDCRDHTEVPILENTSAFTNVPNTLKIIVPDNLYSSWKSASNWSTYASYVVKASEFIY